MLDIKSRELEILRYWEEHSVNDKVRQKNSQGKKFYFLDGPPYVTGDLHPGHIWVKSLKDLFVRYKRFRGYNVVDRAGYDVHGLPIENKIEKVLGISSKKEIENSIGIERFVDECKAFVERYIGRMDADYKRYGISLDFSDPYLPYTNGYIETAWSMFKTISDKGFLYEGTRTLIYCPHCEDPLSQGSMEVEYKDVEDPSIYIMFKVDKARSKAKIEIKDNTYLLVWTTTPWTLPANVAIAANPKELYVEAKFEDKILIMAKPRFDAVAGLIDKSFVVLSEFYGSELEGLHYTSPFESTIEKQKELRKYHKVILSSELVSMEDGTGLVHIAPGHGLEDYALGIKNKLPIFSPVGPDAAYDEDAGIYKGVKVPFDANMRVLEDLESLGVILYKTKITHSYPHCWRCSSKLIFIATKQWFFNVQKIKKKMVLQNEKIMWHPGQVKDWEKTILENSPDWCISRQRYWGIPMPIWRCKGCNEVHVIGSVAELKELAKNKDEVSSLKDLHRPYIDKIIIKCGKCGGEMARIRDILNVWFDSGIAFRASLTAEQFGSFTPTNLVVEYIEQIRAWFQYVLKVSLMTYNKNPFDHIVVHGILFGLDGRKMSKSFGNYKPLNELVDFTAADAFRLWSLDHDPILNRNLNEAEIKENEKPITILYNVANLLSEYEAATKYKPKESKKVSASGIENVDQWILSKLETMVSGVTDSLENYDAYRAAELIKDFVIEDFSRFYLKFAKKNLNDKRRYKKTINVIDYVLFRTLLVSSPLMPFMADGIYTARYKGKESIFLEDWPKVNKRLINKQMEDEIGIAKDAITAILGGREKANIKLRSPILSATIETTDEHVISTIQRLSLLIESYVNAKRINIVKGSSSKREVKPVFAKLGPSFKESANVIADELKKQDASKMEEEVNRSGYFRIHTSRGSFDIKPEHFTVAENLLSGDTMPFKYGLVSIDATQTEELKEELFERDLVRRIQMMRKEMGLTMVNNIMLYLKVDKAVEPLVRSMKEEIKQSVRAKGIAINEEMPKNAFKKSWVAASGGEMEAAITST